VRTILVIDDDLPVHEQGRVRQTGGMTSVIENILLGPPLAPLGTVADGAA
jgi:hypothetical protein